jgi:hypothetical protein
VGRNPYGELDVSAYALARYIDQNDSDGVFTDHLGNDRVMADEFFRPYFGSGVYANGEILPGLW